MKVTRRQRLLYSLPALLVLLIALTNRVVVARTDLSAWELGGFGMFSTIDAPEYRVIRLTAETEGSESVRLEPGRDVAEALDRLSVFPTETRAESIADALRDQRWAIDDGEAEPDDDGLEVVNVEVVVGRATFDEQTQELVFEELVRGQAP